MFKFLSDKYLLCYLILYVSGYIYGKICFNNNSNIEYIIYYIKFISMIFDN